MTDRKGNAVPTPRHETEPLQWSQVESFFREHGCVVVGSPELRWYRESWEALKKAGLTSVAGFTELGLDPKVPRLRALCLMAMYLGIYQAASEYSELGGYFSEHDYFSWYLDSLNLDVEDIWEISRHEGYLETSYESYLEDEEVDDETLYQFAMDITTDETPAIFRALEQYYGGKIGLFVSLWNSRVALDEIEPEIEIVNSFHPGDGKLEVWEYVQNGMKGWTWV